MPCAIITGAAGQDGSYLSEFLLAKGYHVYGMIRRHSSMVGLDRLKEARQHRNFHLQYGDMTDISSIYRLIQAALQDKECNDAPLEIYNLAAQSHVKVSFDTPMYTTHSDAVGVLNILEVIVSLKLQDKVRFYQASTSELFGSSLPPQSETTPFQPRSPYATSKLYAYWMVRNYREGYGLFAVNGILFNHESERRGETFVSRKITRAAAAYHFNPNSCHILTLGNLHAQRDWGHAADYVKAMWMMLQKDTPEDYVIGTGESHTVKEFVTKAFDAIGVEIDWCGNGKDEKGFDASTGALLVQIDPKLYRLTEVDSLCADTNKAKTMLGFQPIVTFDQLVKCMVQYDIDHYSNK